MGLLTIILAIIGAVFIIGAVTGLGFWDVLREGQQLVSDPNTIDNIQDRAGDIINTP